MRGPTRNLSSTLLRSGASRLDYSTTWQYSTRAQDGNRTAPRSTRSIAGCRNPPSCLPVATYYPLVVLCHRTLLRHFTGSHACMHAWHVATWWLRSRRVVHSPYPLPFLACPSLATSVPHRSLLRYLLHIMSRSFTSNEASRTVRYGIAATTLIDRPPLTCAVTTASVDLPRTAQVFLTSFLLHRSSTRKLYMYGQDSAAAVRRPPTYYDKFWSKTCAHENGAWYAS